MKRTIAHWDSKPPGSRARVVSIDPFDAHGMRRVYGRSDRFGRHFSFTMDIWKTRDSRLLMRFWSYCSDIEDCSFEIKGVPIESTSARGSKSLSPEAWVPKTVRAAYDQWILAEM